MAGKILAEEVNERAYPFIDSVEELPESRCRLTRDNAYHILSTDPSVCSHLTMKDRLHTSLEKNEQSPMISPETPDRSTSNGAIDIVSELPPRRAWFSSKFNHLYGLLVVLAVVMLATLVLCIIIAIRLTTVESRAAEAAKNIPQSINEAVEGIKAQFPSGLFLPPPPPPAPTQPKFEAPSGLEPISPSVHGPEERRTEPHFSKWQDSVCTKQCQRSDLKKPPLVILSFDGFSREYLDRGIVTTLEKVASCGATAERVYPSYPSRTFPNHYTIATGLYPESHGIVDNYVFDPSVSPNLESMKTTKYSQLWMGDPIWSVYKKQTGGRAHCLFYPGCAYNASGYPPDVAPPYNKDLPFRNRFEKVREWLNLPADQRPGLITAYFDQPDTIGHYHLDEDDVNEQLVELDTLLEQFLTGLNDDGILNCINLLLISDHGMHRINKTVIFQQELELDGIVTTAGVVGRIYMNGTTRPLNEITSPFECKKGEEMRVFTRDTVPARKHYSKTPRVGDVIVQGEPGTTFYPREANDYHLSADHGFDYHSPSMHTIFFGMGPSIKKKTVLPAFQNIEYLNLFMDLLGLEKSVPNNGTQGVLDEVLLSPPPSKQSTSHPIQECPLSMQFPGVKPCNDCPQEEQNRLNQKLFYCSTNLAFFNKQVPQFNSFNPVCFQNFCNKTLITGTGHDKTVVLIENLSVNDVTTESCEVVNKKYAVDQCRQTNGTASGQRYLSAKLNSDFARIPSTEFNWGEGFATEYFDALNELTQDYLERFQELTVISGIGYDSNLDGIGDVSPSGPPTHFFRILLSCSGTAGQNGYCQNYKDLSTLAFIFPIVQTEINCLPKDKLLLEYTAKIRDVELLTALEFVPRDTPRQHALYLRTHINTQLW